MIKVILLIDCTSEFDRKLLRGMMRYSKENGPWLFYRTPSDYHFDGSREEWIAQWAKEWKADAIIGRWNENKLHLLDELGIPIVLQNIKSRSDIYSNLTGDYIGTGQLAAQYFRKKFYTSYAYFGRKDIIWSEERERGFREEVMKVNSTYSVFVEEPGAVYDRQELTDWLMSLPKGTGLFCSNDAQALTITETCMIAGIKVPEDIAVLGVDDDDLICEISDPTISSIQLEVERGGYETCRLLHQQILSKNRKPFNVVISPSEIKERSSTLAYNISDQHIRNVTRYIDENYKIDISMDNIFQLVPLSRRSVEMRFKKATGMTIYQYILNKRIEHFAYLLITSDKPYIDLAYEVGFKDIANVSRTFRKYKGCTPLEYRKTHH
jgi:LacI family transcriptional regulator